LWPEFVRFGFDLHELVVDFLLDSAVLWCTKTFGQHFRSREALIALGYIVPLKDVSEEVRKRS